MAKNTQSLIHAVSSLPELQERKKVLDKHTNLATNLLVEIKARALDQYHSLAEDLLVRKIRGRAEGGDRLITKRGGWIESGGGWPAWVICMSPHTLAYLMPLSLSLSLSLLFFVPTIRVGGATDPQSSS